MPILSFDAPALTTAPIPGTAYGFSGTRVEDLTSTEYTLVTVVVDRSGSVGPFVDQIAACLGAVAEACRRSPRAPHLLLRATAFDDALLELHGFLPAPAVDPGRYAGLRAGGCTALYDAAVNAVEATARYGADLHQADFDVNALVVVITDGDDNRSAAGPADLRAALRRAVLAEQLEGVTTLLVGVNLTDPALAARLQQLQQDVGFDHFLPLTDADAPTLARLAGLVSRSVTAVSLALGSGAAPSPLQF